jgi:hypothetical protein
LVQSVLLRISIIIHPVFDTGNSESKDPIAEEERIKALGESFTIVYHLSKIEFETEEIARLTHSIEIKSPELQKILRDIFHDYPYWNPDHTPYTSFPPLKPIVNR